MTETLLEIRLARWQKLGAELDACTAILRDAIERDDDLAPADRERVTTALSMSVYEFEQSALGRLLAQLGLIEADDAA